MQKKNGSLGWFVAGLLAVLVIVGCTANFTTTRFENNFAAPRGETDKGVALGSSPQYQLDYRFGAGAFALEVQQDAESDLAGALEGGLASLGGVKDSSANYDPFIDSSQKNPTTTTTTTATSAVAKPTVTPTDDSASAGNGEVDDGTGAVDQGTTETSDDTAYAKKATYTSYGTRNGGRQAWRIPKKGPEFGKSVKIVFSNGSTFTVPNTSKNCRDREDTCKRDRSAPMYGFVFKPGIGPNGDGDDNTGTSHGGVYLHAPYGNSSTTATFYYSEP